MRTVKIEIPEHLAIGLASYMENLQYDEPITREYLKDELGEDTLVKVEDLYDEITSQLLFSCSEGPEDEEEAED